MAPCSGVYRLYVPSKLPTGPVPLLVGRGSRLGQRGDANALHRIPVAELPGQVVAGDEIAQTWVIRRNVVILEIDLDEGLPVVVALVHLDVVELVAGEIELIGDIHAGQVDIGRARPLELQTVPVFQPSLA